MNTILENNNINFDNEVMNMNSQRMRVNPNRNIMDIDFADINEFQLEQIMQKANDARFKILSEKVENVTNEQKKQKTLIQLQEKQIEETSERSKKTEDRINVIGFGIHSKKGQILRKLCAGRVLSILGDRTNFNHLLWSHYFYKKVYSDLAHWFEVDTYRNIHIDNYEQAKSFALSWSPDAQYIYNKTQELIEKRNNGTLSQIRAMALSAYLEASNNGTINLF